MYRIDFTFFFGLKVISVLLYVVNLVEFQFITIKVIDYNIYALLLKRNIVSSFSFKPTFNFRMRQKGKMRPVLMPTVLARKRTVRRRTEAAWR